VHRYFDSTMKDRRSSDALAGLILQAHSKKQITGRRTPTERSSVGFPAPRGGNLPPHLRRVCGFATCRSPPATC